MLGLLTTPVLGQARLDTLDYFSIRAMSASGTVLVGTHGENMSIWSSSEGRWQFLGHATPVAISGDGSVVAGYYSLDNAIFFWTQEDGTRYLSDVFGSIPDSYHYLYNPQLRALSEDGSTIVGTARYSTNPFFSNNQAFRWSLEDGFQVSSPPDDFNVNCHYRGSAAYDVSGDGSVAVGSNRRNDCREEAIRWTGDTVQGLGFLSGALESSATAVSADGSTVVGQSGEQAFRWSTSGGMQGLGFLDGGYNKSTVLDVSGDGSVVVGEAWGTDSLFAFIWTAEEGMRRLDEVLVEKYQADLRGWRLESAVAISDDGRIIAGLGRSESGIVGSWRVVLCGSKRLWENTTGGTFADAANWALNAVPDSMSSAHFGASGTYTVIFDDDAASNGLEAENGANVTLDLDGHTWALKSGCTAPSAIIKSAFMDVAGGTIDAVESVVLTGEEPVLNVDSDGRLVIDSDENGSGCLVADGETGEALVSVAGEVESRTCGIFGGSAETTGRLVMDMGGRFTTDTLTVGGEGTGTVEIAHGHVEVDVLQMALEESSTATLTAENVGSLHFQNSASVGVRAEATLNLRNVGMSGGGEEGEVSLLVLGKELSGQGQFILEDHSFFQNSDAVVGQDGIGNIQLKSGSTATIRRIWIGGHLESTEGVGGVFVDGAGSRLTARRIWIGRGGFGELKVSNGGLVEADRIEVYGYGNAESAGGTIDAPILYVGGGGNKTRTVDQHGVVVDTLVLSGDGVTLTADETVLGPDGVMNFTLDETNIGTTITGGIVLGGTLRIEHGPTHTPEVGQEYLVLTSASVQGVFDRIVTTEDVEVEISYTSTAVMVTVTAVSVSSDRNPSVTSYYSLHEPYPNPFSRSTRISFEVSEAGYVQLTAYDLLGREVSRLFEGHVTMGSHEVEFEAGHLPNGVYLLSLKTSGGLKSGKVVLAR